MSGITTQSLTGRARVGAVYELFYACNLQHFRSDERFFEDRPGGLEENYFKTFITSSLSYTFGPTLFGPKEPMAALSTPAT